MLELSSIQGKPYMENSNLEQNTVKSESSQQSSGRKQQPFGLYVAVCISQIVTIFLSLLLLLVPIEKKQYVYLTYIILTVVRVIIFFSNTLKLMGWSKQILTYYLLVDSTLMLYFSTVVTYVFLNYKVQVPFAIPAIACYPIILFFLIGNFRVMMARCRWRPCQTIIYKLIKIGGSVYFLIYGSYVVIDSELQNSDLLLLWIFTTCGFWGQMAQTMSEVDGADGMCTDYVLQD